MIRRDTAIAGTRWAGIAQLVEQATCNRQVVGSMPAASPNHPARVGRNTWEGTTRPDQRYRQA